MCDYSLQNIASRPAKVGDKLRVSNFEGAYSKGFADVTAELSPEGKAFEAVCVLPGTEIAFDSNIESVWYAWDQGAQVYTSNVGIFRQVDKEQQYVHHDALELPDGVIVKLASLKLGSTATVLQLPAAPKNEAEVKEQTRLEVVG